MSRIPVKDFKDGDMVLLQTFYVSELFVGKTKNGKDYANLKLSDKTGNIAAKVWDWADAPKELFKVGGFLDVSGPVSTYNNTLQLTVKGYGPATTTDKSEFEKVSKFDPDEMHRNFLGYIDCFNHDWFRKVATKIHEKYSGLFHTKPAATGMHHAFKHGLLEHTVQMLQTDEALLDLPIYADALNRDLCMFGIMFHDYGKIFEYGDGPGFQTTVSGRKVGHIPKMGAIIYHEATLLGVPEVIVDEMMSVVLSHHGRVAWGSPNPPSSPEAWFVHYVDNLHGTVFGVLQRIEDDNSPSETVKHGFNEDACYVPKKRFSKLLKEIDDGASCEDDVEDTSWITGTKTQVDGF